MRCYVGWVFITVFLLQEMRSSAWMVAESRACHISKPSSSSGTSSQDKSLFFSQEESSKWKSKWAERSKKHPVTRLPNSCRRYSILVQHRLDSWEMISSLSRQTRGRRGHAYPCVTRDTCPPDELQPLSRNWWKLENSSWGSRLGLGLELSKKYYHLSHCVNSCTKTSILTISSTVSVRKCSWGFAN